MIDPEILKPFRQEIQEAIQNFTETLQTFQVGKCAITHGEFFGTSKRAILDQAHCVFFGTRSLWRWPKTQRRQRRKSPRPAHFLLPPVENRRLQWPSAAKGCGLQISQPGTGFVAEERRH